MQGYEYEWCPSYTVSRYYKVDEFNNYEQIRFWIIHIEVEVWTQNQNKTCLEGRFLSKNTHVLSTGVKNTAHVTQTRKKKHRKWSLDSQKPRHNHRLRWDTPPWWQILQASWRSLLATTVLQVGPYINDFKHVMFSIYFKTPVAINKQKLHQKLPFFQVDFCKCWRVGGWSLVSGLGRVWDFSSHRPQGNQITNLINQTSWMPGRCKGY